MPRMALGYLFFALARILTEVDLVVATHAELAEAVARLESLARELGPTRATAQNEAKRLALAIGDRLPAVYGGPATGAVAYRWKTDLEENAKILALAGTLPEMTHNEIEAWRGRATPRPDLVVGHLGQGSPQRQDLRGLLQVGLPAVRDRSPCRSSVDRRPSA